MYVMSLARKGTISQTKIWLLLHVFDILVCHMLLLVYGVRAVNVVPMQENTG
jgi:hypothetical protein